jgi:hypothetical protein
MSLMSLKTHFKKIGTSKVLIVEPNSYHGELLPGFTYLFQKLGFRVEILSTYDVHKENPFCKYPMELIPKFHFGDENYIKDFLEENSKRYYLLFFQQMFYGKVKKPMQVSLRNWVSFRAGKKAHYILSTTNLFRQR